MKRVIVPIFIFGCILSARDRIDDDKGSFYLTVNPVAAVAQMPGFYTKLVAPFVSNFEYGLSVTAGYLLTPSQSVDVKLVLGSSEQISFTPQLHAGYNFFVLDQFDLTNKGLYLGADLRFLDKWNTMTGVHYFDLIPSARLGYFIEISRFIMDFRINQWLGAFSWTTKDHTSPSLRLGLSPLPDVTPVFPLLSLNLGWKF
jgi:hypothetical protein